MNEPHLTGPLDDPEVRFVDSLERTYSLWDAAHNAPIRARREFDELAREITGETYWCDIVFGPDQHGKMYDHDKHMWVPA